MASSSSSIQQIPYYKNYWVSRMLSSIAFQMLSVAIGWQMYELTHDAFSLGLVGLAQFLPMVLLTLVVGHFADRYDRRYIVFLCQIVEGVIALLLLLGSLTNSLGQNHILVMAAILGACRAFEGPSSSALLPQLVPKEFLQQAISWNTSVGQLSQILGPSMGGLLYWAGSSFVYTAASLALLTAGILTFFIRSTPIVRKSEPVSLRSLFSGIMFVYRQPIILGTISLDLFAVLLGGATALLPIFSQDILHTGPWGLGLMRTAPAIGALLMSIVLVYYPLKKAVGYILFAALAVFGLATMLFAVSSHLFISLVALFFIGASDVISVIIRSSLVQLQTPDEMRGRVNAVNSLFIGTSNQLGEFESGTLAGFIGAVPAVFVGGLGTLAIAGLWMYLFPSLRKMRTLSEQS
ncbi:MFS transporter [Paenibacillus chondroitinus]|uniref:Multidrug efflux pump Tap n=1 Tax=Paenibacillus chondroitinus TaxID=59842 RepID=A0ABU6DN48_9BACL|nr:MULTISPECIES: MFS transporter [Paenibacillus]MCY9663123.1 MFS transporter [Paenibacillus anseongense]MEB4799204.1 MFS transporter [Paenibacillus chondroitinus]